MPTPPPLTPLAAAVLRVVPAPERVLEVECGEGEGVLFLAREFPVARVRGVDSSSEPGPGRHRAGRPRPGGARRLQAGPTLRPPLSRRLLRPRRRDRRPARGGGGGPRPAPGRLADPGRQPPPATAWPGSAVGCCGASLPVAASSRWKPRLPAPAASLSPVAAAPIRRRPANRLANSWISRGCHWRCWSIRPPREARRCACCLASRPPSTPAARSSAFSAPRASSTRSNRHCWRSKRASCRW